MIPLELKFQFIFQFFGVIFPDDILSFFFVQAAAKATLCQGSLNESFPTEKRKGLCQKGGQCFSVYTQLCPMYPNPVFSVNISCRSPSYLQFEKIKWVLQTDADFKEKMSVAFSSTERGGLRLSSFGSKRAWQFR